MCLERFRVLENDIFAGIARIYQIQQSIQCPNTEEKIAEEEIIPEHARETVEMGKYLHNCGTCRRLRKKKKRHNNNDYKIKIQV